MNKVLMYHSTGSVGISEIGADLYSVSADNFKEQMDYVSLSFHRPTSYEQRATSSITVTFDDGILNNYTIAYPILRDKGFKGYFFILVSKIGTAGYMGWQQIRDLHDNGMIIGSHGM